MDKLREAFNELCDQLSPHIESLLSWLAWIMFKVRCVDCDKLLTRDEVEYLGSTCCECENESMDAFRKAEGFKCGCNSHKYQPVSLDYLKSIADDWKEKNDGPA